MGLVAIPVNRPVIFRLSSNDVVHSFFLPNFRVKMDVVPGMTTAMHVQATKTGDYEVVCAELCGLAHYRMRALIHVKTEQEFGAWVQQLEEEASEAEDEY